MANKIPIAVILVLAGATVLVLLGQNLLADSEDTQSQSMVFEWDYADSLPPVDYWEVEVKRVVAGYENMLPPRTLRHAESRSPRHLRRCQDIDQGEGRERRGDRPLVGTGRWNNWANCLCLLKACWTSRPTLSSHSATRVENGTVRS